MHLKLAGYDNIIQKLGRWSSTTYQTYIQSQIGQLTAGVARRMAAIALRFHIIAKQYMKPQYYNRANNNTLKKQSYYSGSAIRPPSIQMALTHYGRHRSPPRIYGKAGAQRGGVRTIGMPMTSKPETPPLL
jgi:hypothetical protein